MSYIWNELYLYGWSFASTRCSELAAWAASAPTAFRVKEPCVVRRSCSAHLQSWKRVKSEKETHEGAKLTFACDGVTEVLVIIASTLAFDDVLIFVIFLRFLQKMREVQSQLATLGRGCRPMKSLSCCCLQVLTTSGKKLSEKNDRNARKNSSYYVLQFNPTLTPRQ